MKYKAVLFDMDGTVLDTIEDLHDSVNYSLQHFGYAPISMQETMANLGNGARYLIRKSCPPDLTEQQLEEILTFYTAWYNDHSLIKTRAFAGIPELMEALSANGSQTVIISNKPHHIVEKLGQIIFPGIACYGERPGIPRKPDPAAVLKTLEELNIAKEDAFYICDTEVDVLTAKNAGVDCIAVSWGFRSLEDLHAAGAKVIASTVAELGQLLQ